MNRAVRGQKLFAKAGDYAAFEALLGDARARQPADAPMRLFSYVLMPNHFHLLLCPSAEGQVSSFMKWLTMTHTQRVNAHRNLASRGHLYQSRFKSFPVQLDGGFFYSVARYIERNPLRAGLTKHLHDYEWSSFAARELKLDKARTLLDTWPVRRPANWTTRLNTPETQAELNTLRNAAERGTPFGEPAWVLSTARQLNLNSSLVPRGRPRKAKSRTQTTR